MSRAKRVIMYRNGDQHFPAKNIVCDPKVMTNLDHFLDFIAPKFQPYGSLERLYQIDGKRLKTVDQLIDGGKYVVAKKEKFRPVPYDSIVNVSETERAAKQLVKARQLEGVSAHKPPALPPVRRKKKLVKAKGKVGQTLKGMNPRSVWLLRNGDPGQKAYKMVFNGRNAMNWDQVCQRVSNKLDTTSPCRSIWTIAGQQVHNIPDLEGGKTYVAVSRQGFRQLGYKPVQPPEKKAPRARGPTLKRRGAPKGLPNMLPKMEKIPTLPPIEPSPSPVDEDEDEDEDEDGDRETLDADDTESRAAITARAARKSAAVKVSKSKKFKTYELEITTSQEENAGTQGEVHVNLKGKNGDTGFRMITESVGEDFQQGSVDNFSMDAPWVGEITGADIKVEGDENESAMWWLCEKIVAQDEGGTRAYLHFNAWVKPEDENVITVKASQDANGEGVQGALAVPDGFHRESTLMEFADNSKQVKRFWKQVVDPEGHGVVAMEDVVDSIQENYPQVADADHIARVHSWVGEDADVTKKEFPMVFVLLVHSHQLGQLLGTFDSETDVTKEAFVANIQILWPEGPGPEDIEEIYDGAGAVPDFAAVSVAYGKARCPDVFYKKEKKKKKKKAASTPPTTPPTTKKKKRKAKKAAPQLEFNATDLDTLEAIRDPDAVEHLWSEIDPDSAGAADVEAIIERVASFYPDLVDSHDSAVDRSIEHSAQADPDRNTMTTDEFGSFLMNLFGFGKVLDAVGADSKPLSLKRFKAALKALRISLSSNEQGQEFDAMPSNDGGKIEVDDMCLWYVEYLSTAECVPEGSTGANGEVPKYSTEAFDDLESEIMAIAKDPVKMKELWDVIDFNDNQLVSLAEIDKLMVQDYPLLNHKPALMRAYKQTCLKEGGDGDAWVEPDEFPQLLVNLFYFNKLFQCFEQIDTDDDRRMDEKEFMQGIDDLGMSLSDDEAKASFDDMDSNDGGIVLFDEFCIWFTKQVDPGREIVDSTSQFVESRNK